MKILNKVCIKCNIKKPLSEFYKKKDGRFGVGTVCKICTKTHMKFYRIIYSKEIRSRKKDYYEINKEAITKQKREYYIANREKIIAKKKIYYEINKDKIRVRSRNYRNVYYKKRRQSDPMHRLNHNMSANIRWSLKNGKNGSHWENIVNYTLNDLKKHLEKLFTEGMSWDNYGEWQIDHKIPISAFNFTKAEHKDFKRCWALSNLQPMWAKENIIKSNKLNKPFQPSLII